MADRRPELPQTVPSRPVSSAVSASPTPPRASEAGCCRPFFGFKIRLKFLSRFFSTFWRFLVQKPSQIEPKLTLKSNFWLLFSDTFSDYVFGSIFDRFLEAPSLKIINFTKEKQRFSRNRRFRKSSKKSSFWPRFSRSKSIKIEKKCVFELISFFNIVW